MSPLPAPAPAPVNPQLQGNFDFVTWNVRGPAANFRRAAR